MEKSEEKRNRRRGRPRGRKGETRRTEEKNEKVEELIRKIKEELVDSIEPICLHDLNAYERKLIHRYFERGGEITTKTYRIGEEDYELRIFPVGNLRRYAQKMADQAVSTRQKVVLPPMSSYERFIIHDYLKSLDTVKTHSVGEGDDRHIEIESAAVSSASSARSS